MENITLVLANGNENCYIIYDKNSKEAAIVDPGYEFEKIKDIIEDNFLNPQYILLTHAHSDHIGAVEELKNFYGNLKLGVNEKDEVILKSPELNLSEYLQGRPISLSPDFYIKDDDEIKIGSEIIKVFETPGHSPGGVSFYVDDKLYSGDSLFRFSVGRTDFYLGDMNELIRGIKEKLMVLPDETIVYPGHGEITTIGDERKWNPFIR